MKTLLLLLVSAMGFAQSMGLTQNTTLGQNCGNGQTTNLFVGGDLNLNGYTLTLRNVSLVITGNLNGSGSVIRCGNFDHSSVCVTGSTQNNVNLNGVSCSVLSTDTFVLSNKTIGLPYKVYDVTGKEIQKGLMTWGYYSTLPSAGLLFIKVEGYKAFKRIKQ